jgi:acetyltransferase
VASPLDAIEELARPPAERDLRGLALLLVDAVESGASVSFLPPLALSEARQWWQRALESAPPRARLLVWREAGELQGCVQLCPAWAPNQRHRAEVAKLLVHSRARRRGIGRALMGALEECARSSGFELLTLDTRAGDAAEALYRGCGWSEAGAIPGYARSADGSLCDTRIFYKRLEPRGCA